MTQPGMASPLAGRSLRPPFCLVVDWVGAAILAVLIAVGVDLHH
jgi:hypothetical protein